MERGREEVRDRGGEGEEEWEGEEGTDSVLNRCT
jgi:hypothetical protein